MDLITAELARQHRNDLRRDAARERRVLVAARRVITFGRRPVSAGGRHASYADCTA